jgi:hypothetical protein
MFSLLQKEKAKRASKETRLTKRIKFYGSDRVTEPTLSAVIPDAEFR